MKKWIAGVIVALVPGTASAIDPECVGLSPEPPVFIGCQRKADTLVQVLNFCSPQVDTDLDPLPVGALQSCSVSMDGAVQVITVADPGIVISVTVQGKNPGHAIEAWCTNVEGNEGTHWTSDFCFPHGNPHKPHLK